MESFVTRDSDDPRQPQRRRGRPRSIRERIRFVLEMPRLTRAERNQRVVIVTAILVVVLYFLLRPLFPALGDHLPAPSSTPVRLKPEPPPKR